MLELMNGTRVGVGPKLPSNTGPGPTELLGYNDTMAFFGELTHEELPTITELCDFLELSQQGNFNTTSKWLKIFMDQRVLFISKKPLKHSISFNDLLGVGVISHDAVLEFHGQYFKVTLLKGIREGSDTPLQLGDDTVITHGSEWNDTLYPLSQDNSEYPKVSQVGPNVASYTETQLGLTGNGRENLTLDENPENTNLVITRGGTRVTQISARDKALRSSVVGWRVVLELLEDDLYPVFITRAISTFIDTLTTEDLLTGPVEIHPYAHISDYSAIASFTTE